MAAWPPRHRVVVRGDQASGPVELLGRRRERPVGQRHLRRVDAELAPVAERPALGGVGEEVVLGVEVGDDLVDRGHAGQPGRQRHPGPGVEHLGLPSVRTPPMSATKSSAPKYATATGGTSSSRTRSTPIGTLDARQHVEVVEAGSGERVGRPWPSSSGVSSFGTITPVIVGCSPSADVVDEPLGRHRVHPHVHRDARVVGDELGADVACVLSWPRACRRAGTASSRSSATASGVERGILRSTSGLLAGANSRLRMRAGAGFTEPVTPAAGA